jgi:hypothetical protein
MGFNKQVILKKHQLQQMVYDHGVEYVIKYYSKADAVIGDAESVDYLKSLKVTLKENKKQ